MKQFSIDLKNSNKGERKKAVKYLREQGYTVQRKKDRAAQIGLSSVLFLYLSNFSERSDDFGYYSVVDNEEQILTLPKDWDLLIKYTQKKPEKKVVEKKELKKFEVGVWYKCVSMLGRYQGDNRGVVFCGRRWTGDFGVSMSYPKDWTKATPKEIEECLTIEAEKRGFKKGVRFKSAYSGDTGECNGCFLYESDDSLSSNGMDIYHQGKWAEITEEPFTINGHEVRSWKSKNTTQFTAGCFSSDYSYLAILISQIERFKTQGVELSVKVKGENVSLEDLKRLKTHLDEH